jgi:hypothetical protein
VHSPTVVWKNKSINPNKIVIILFTRKNIKGLKEPNLFSKMTQLSSEVKYLGIWATLDKGLTRKKQLNIIIKKDYMAFWTYRGTFGKSWGLKPRVIYWIYTAVVRPIATYAATIWWTRVNPSAPYDVHHTSI